MSNHQHKEADALMAAIANGPSLTRSLVIAVVVHLAVIGIASIPYLLQASSYGTLNVREAMDQERLAAEEEARAQRVAERQEKLAEGARQAPTTDFVPVKGPVPEPPPREPSKGEVIREQPTESGLNVDEDFGL